MHRSSLSPSTRPHVAAVVASRDRSEDFLARCLGSILRQTRPPDVLVFVNDATDATDATAESVRAERARLVRRLTSNDPRLVLLDNVRTPGLSGALNTAIDQLHRRHAPEQVFLAFLDDDDEWTLDHLAECMAAIEAGCLDMTASGLVRIEDPAIEGRRQSIPESLDPQTLLAEGQHIQGSNVVVRLDRLLLAGAFDENLPSCTDRDLVLRLAELPELRYGPTRCHTVRHYADLRQDRLSTSGSESKRTGLHHFYAKWKAIMLPATEERFLARAKDLFDWSPESYARPSVRSDELRNHEEAVPQSAAFVIGIIVDPATPERVEPLLRQLRQIATDPLVVGLDVLLLENGALGQDSARLHAVVKRARESGLRVYLLDRSRQVADTRDGRIGIHVAWRDERLSIAEARTLIASYAAAHAKSRKETWVWLLDDDARLNAFEPPAPGTPTRNSPDIAHLHRLRKQGVRVVYGSVAGAPPLPFVACLRTQAIDTLQVLLAARWRGSNALVPNESARLAELRALERDYFYDLSRQGTRLQETPFPLPVGVAQDSLGESLVALAARLPRALAGEQVTRPLVVVPGKDDEASIRRGPSTLWFSPDDVLLAPNALLQLHGEYPRRSDMLVALLSRNAFGLKSVESAAIAVRQDRDDVAPRADLEKLRLDVLGFAIYSALKDVFDLRSQNGSSSRDLAATEFTPQELDLAVDKFRKYVEERCYAYSLSAWRLRGVLSAATKLRDECQSAQSSDQRPAWTEIHREIAAIAQAATVEGAHELLARCLATDASEIRRALAGIAPAIHAFRNAGRMIDRLSSKHDPQRIDLARVAVRTVFGVDPKLTLGAGSEGVVLSDEHRVFKVIDSWKARDAGAKKAFLASLRGKWTTSPSLPPILEFADLGTTAVIVTPFEPSLPYTGKHGPGMIQLLRECRRVGVVCRNIVPKNLRVCDERVLLVDYGSDLVPFDAVEFRQMAKRAWLTWRWHHRPDLPVLMRRALDDETLPELVGFERFLEAVEVPSLSGMLDPLLLRACGEVSGKHVLDFGCGKGRLAMKLAAAGARVVAYDPDASHAPRWAKDAVGAATPPSFSSSRQQIAADAPYDVVVASLVLCEISDASAYRAALADFRRCVRDDGHVVIAVCNPFFTFGGPTPMHPTRQIPAGTTYDDVFVLDETVAPASAARKDVHRPLAVLRRDLLAAGLAIEAISESETVDLERFEPASDFLVLTLRPLPTPSPDVSVIVKTCPQEWETVEAQVQHLVSTLEGPVPFRERLLAVDDRRRDYPRQYALADAVAFEAAVARLLRAGVVDRVVRAPVSDVALSDLNARWFGVHAPATYAANGQATAAFLAALDTCASPFVLQCDSDVMIARTDRRKNWLQPLLDCFARDSAAATASLSIAHDADSPFAPGPWRVETRAALLHRERLLRLRPLPNAAEGGALALPWHRALDVVMNDGRATSYRGADRTVCFVHPPNDRKRDRRAWMQVLDGVERARLPAGQIGRVDLVPAREDFLPRMRHERFIFVITGRNVEPGRMRRCLDSLTTQRQRDWGAVVVDDASDRRGAEYLELWCERHADQVTLMRPRLRRGQLANLVDAIRVVCTDPESVILTLDLDDALLGPDVLDHVAKAYSEGADLTVGSMLRTDKFVEYVVDFSSPRERRGGNVWQHLRTFKKRLFDAIPDEALRHDGEYFDLATDWAFMLPMVERATRPRWIRRPLYLYETSGNGKGFDRHRREHEIAYIVSLPSQHGAAAPVGVRS